MPVVNTHDFFTRAREAGIADIGVCQVTEVPEQVRNRHLNYLQEGRQAGMQYLGNHLEKRFDPRLLVENARSIIATVFPYRPRPQWETNPHIALYAQGRDYHQVVKEKLFSIASLLEPSPSRCFCDTAPVLEKYWAVQCGLGHIGRNTLLIHPQLGSFCFIGVILTQAEFSHYSHPLYDTPFPSSLPFSPDTTGEHPCQNCDLCIRACPGQALSAKEGMDARKCYSYLTIEHKGPRPALHSRYWYGCDLCQEVCPFNRKTRTIAGNGPDQIFSAKSDLSSLTLSDFQPTENTLRLTPEVIQALTPGQFRKQFKGSAMERAGLEGLKMNVEAWDIGHHRVKEMTSGETRQDL